MSQSGYRQFLTALQLADSFFPTGMFAHSHGLESMVARGLVRSRVDVGAFLSTVLQCSLIPADGVALYNAHDATSRRQLAAVAAID
jgi:urease accessory protein